MIPIRDQNPTRHAPVMNYLLITANVLVFLFFLMAGDNQEALVYQFALIPSNITAGVDLGDVRDHLHQHIDQRRAEVGAAFELLGVLGLSLDRRCGLVEGYLPVRHS